MIPAVAADPAPDTVAAAPAAVAQYRYEIVSAADTTFAFVAPGTAWLVQGSLGIVVDPRKRDELVARFKMLGRSVDTVTAMVTGQTRKVSVDHVAVLAAPPPPVRMVPVAVVSPSRRARLLRQRAFWVGILAGGALGAGAAVVAR